MTLISKENTPRVWDKISAVLESEGYSTPVNSMMVDELPPPPPATCRTCGNTHDLVGQIRVIAQPGEEGHAEEEHTFCDQCLNALLTTLVLFGFGNHKHGGINFLEDYRCPATGQPGETCTETTPTS